jgi:hypothetical protein
LNPIQTSVIGFLHGMQESPCLAFHRWHVACCLCVSPATKFPTWSRKQALIVVTPTSEKNAASTLHFTQPMWGSPSISSRRWKIIAFIMFHMINNKPIIPHIVCHSPRFGLVSSDCHSKLHHFDDAICSRKALQFYP